MTFPRSAPSLDNLRPALAGLVVDHTIDRKEVYATFINLVERGFITNNGAGNRQRFAVSKPYLKNPDLAEYEKRVLVQLPDSGEVNETELRAKLDLLSEDVSFKRAVANEAVRHELYRKGMGGDFALHTSHIQWSDPVTIVRSFVYVFFPVLFLIIAFCAFAVWISGLTLSSSDILTLAVFVVIGTIVFSSMFAIMSGVVSASSAIFERKFLSDYVSDETLAQRKRYRELLEWLEANPLRNYRWSNEFLPYAVAFGLYKDYEKFPK